ncbi:MAG: outer membrane lipoprotein carrier protein LolA [Chitinophagaceae bacterium]|nr:outer membrane lipoprotein carrier protein LolA [Chitinophagaceae bacterium]
MRSVLLICIMMIAFAVKAQYAGYKPVSETSDFKSRFVAVSQKTNTIKSDFVQEKNLSLLSEKIVSNGKFWFKKENLVRMEYTQPFQYLMVINGTDVYIKDSQKENKISARSNKLFQQINKVIVDCVNGNALDSRDFTAKIFEGANAFLAELTPVNKQMKSMFRNINIYIDKKEFAVSKIEMHEPSEDNTVITFRNRELNTLLADALFAIH